MAGEQPRSIGAALAAGIDGLDAEKFEQFKRSSSQGELSPDKFDKSLPPSHTNRCHPPMQITATTPEKSLPPAQTNHCQTPSAGTSWCQRMKAAERDALAELSAADAMEMQLASLRRQETPGHRATQGGLLGSVRRGNLFDSPEAGSDLYGGAAVISATPEPPDRPSPEVADADGTRSPTIETLMQQLTAAEQARSLAEQRHDQLSREAQEDREKADAEIRAERNRAVEALAVAEEARAVADSAAQRCAESDRLLSATRAEAAAMRLATEHEQSGMISTAEAAGLRTELAAQEESRWAAEKELSNERAARRAAEAAIRTEQRKTATIRVAAEQAAQTAQRQADATQQAWDLKQAELVSSCGELKRELLLAQQQQSNSDGGQPMPAEDLAQINALMEENADLQAKVKHAEEAGTAQMATLQSLEADIAEARARAQTSEQQLQQCRIELKAAEDRARSAELTATASGTELDTVRNQLQAAMSANDADATAARELEQLRRQHVELEAEHNSTMEHLLQAKTLSATAEKALQDEREQVSANVKAVDDAVRQRAALEQELSQASAEVASLKEAAISSRHQIDEATAAQTTADSALHQAQEQISRLQQELESESASRTEAQAQLDAMRAMGDTAELQAGAAQAELVMVRAQLQAAQSLQQREHAEAQKEIAQAAKRQKDVERHAESERAKVLDLSSRLASLEEQLATTQRLSNEKAASMSEALNAAQAELAAVREIELNGSTQVTHQAQELQIAKETEVQLQEKLAAANTARIEAEEAVEAANARATEVKAESTSKLQAMSQKLLTVESSCTVAKRELDALKSQKATAASSSDFPGEVAVDGAPTRAELNATIELAQKLLANQTEVCTVEKEANASLHEALGDVTAQLKEAEAVAARWEAATHASTQLLQHYGYARRADHEDIPPEDVDQYAEYLGFDLSSFPELRWLAEEACDAPLPADWASHTDADGELFYYSTAGSGTDSTSTYDHPLDAHFKTLYSLMREERTGLQLGRRDTPTIYEDVEEHQQTSEAEGETASDADLSGSGDEGSDTPVFSTPSKSLHPDMSHDTDDPIPEEEMTSAKTT